MRAGLGVRVVAGFISTDGLDRRSHFRDLRGSDTFARAGAGADVSLGHGDDNDPGGMEAGEALAMDRVDCAVRAGCRLRVQVHSSGSGTAGSIVWRRPDVPGGRSRGDWRVVDEDDDR